MTNLEWEALATMEEVLTHFSVGRRLTNTTFVEVMGHVRDTVKHLRNKSYACACATGLHAGRCTCKPPVFGKCRL